MTGSGKPVGIWRATAMERARITPSQATGLTRKKTVEVENFD